MRVTRSLLASAVLCLASACSDESPSPFEPEVGPIPDASDVGQTDITVMTRNLYVGADVDAVIGALVTPDPADDQAALLAAIATLQQTDFPARAVAFADEIGRTRPHVVGLQEVSTIDISLPPLGVEVHLDFLPVLLAELSARGLEYDVAARVRNIEAAPFPGVSLLDEDAVLVDGSRVEVQQTSARRFTANLGAVAPGVTLARGWVMATVTIGGQSYTVASTHLESGDAPGLAQLRAAQAGELAQALASATPAILMGDLNDVPGSPMYQVLVGAGFTDVWQALRPGVSGFTCCHLSDLSNRTQAFHKRIDYVFASNGGEGEHFIGRIDPVGDVPADRLPDSRLWPSDHAGLVAWLDMR
jgi:endonuclease/exonuclease/phosphatase family metal-dependent hydrolase